MPTSQPDMTWENTESSQIFNHMAVNLEHYIVVLGGRTSMTNYIPLHEIWAFNIYTEQWERHLLPQSEIVPKERADPCAVGIGSDLYMFGGFIGAEYTPTNSLWKLARSSRGFFAWSEIVTTNNEKAPSPRGLHSGWEYGGLYWTFGGVGVSPIGYLYKHGAFDGDFDESGCNNQLLCYNPSNEQWTNPQCYGQIPMPCTIHAATARSHKAWLYGGSNGEDHVDDFYDLYELNMHLYKWTQIKTNQIKPQVWFTALSVISHGLVLHGGHELDNTILHDTWIMDLPSQAWRRLTSVKDVPRQFHTSSRVINNNLIIIGGNGPEVSMTNTFQIMFEPKSLQQLAMKTACNHLTILPWRKLPKKLKVLLGFY